MRAHFLWTDPVEQWAPCSPLHARGLTATTHTHETALQCLQLAWNDCSTVEVLQHRSDLLLGCTPCMATRKLD